MHKLAVFGDPVAHSLSPTIHQQFARVLRIDVDYRAIHATSEAFIETLSEFRNAGGMGANITLPHKQTAIACCKELSKRAKQAAAANTLIRTGNGWYGDNTDGEGLLWDLRRQNQALQGCHVVLLGAGGAARGVVPALLESGVAQVTIANRTASRARSLAAVFDDCVTAIPVDDIASLPVIHLLVNATAAGHTRESFHLPHLTECSPYCYDLSYGTASRSFLQWAEKCGYQNSDGLGMLVGQAAESFSLWTGETVSDSIRQQTLAMLG